MDLVLNKRFSLTEVVGDNTNNGGEMTKYFKVLEWLLYLAPEAECFRQFRTKLRYR
ncbi:hypothetical protein AAFN85_09220 [Mucilaginibacter sp. CAU 1740]|uniref:hypothetical protein n=1 Tax=Mucilaginibacter sp. CAU 1740 TaxID=3140365 RepID=UPI00325B24DE